MKIKAIKAFEILDSRGTPTIAALIETDDDFKDKIKRNVEHLEIIKEYKKLDETTSIWTSEDFTAIDKAVVDGKKVYS